MVSPKIYLLTYADKKYAKQQGALTAEALKSKCFDGVIPWGPETFWDTDFMRTYSNILCQPRGSGYWLWKPYIIMQALASLDPGDILIYADCGDKFVSGPSFREDIIKAMESTSVMLTSGAFRQSAYTKRDCFVIMGCDEEKYHNAIQVEAGISIWKSCGPALVNAKDWLNYCTLDNGQALTDEPNKCGKDNLPDFVDHRHDQSILTNLAVKYGIAQSGVLRPYFHCNQNNL